MQSATTITVFGLGLTARDGAVVLIALTVGLAVPIRWRPRQRGLRGFLIQREAVRSTAAWQSRVGSAFGLNLAPRMSKAS